MRRKQAVPTARNVFGALDVVSELLEAVLDNAPRIAVVVSRKVPSILQDDESRTMSFHDLSDLMKESARGRVIHSCLSSGLREGLTGEAGTENVVLRNVIFRRSDVSDDSRPWGKFLL